MVNYNPEVLRKWAGRLYRQAYTVILYYTIGFLVIAFFLIEYDISPLEPELTYILLLIIGIGVGLYKTLEKRARAQRDLCLVRIEKHLEEISKNNGYVSKDKENFNFMSKDERDSQKLDEFLEGKKGRNFENISKNYKDVSKDEERFNFISKDERDSQKIDDFLEEKKDKREHIDGICLQGTHNCPKCGKYTFEVEYDNSGICKDCHYTVREWQG